MASATRTERAVEVRVITALVILGVLLVS